LIIPTEILIRKFKIKNSERCLNYWRKSTRQKMWLNSINLNQNSIKRISSTKDWRQRFKRSDSCRSWRKDRRKRGICFCSIFYFRVMTIRVSETVRRNSKRSILWIIRWNSLVSFIIIGITSKRGNFWLHWLWILNSKSTIQIRQSILTRKPRIK